VLDAEKAWRRVSARHDDSRTVGLRAGWYWTVIASAWVACHGYASIRHRGEAATLPHFTADIAATVSGFNGGAAPAVKAAELAAPFSVSPDNTIPRKA
jgi:hypothetical protein